MAGQPAFTGADGGSVEGSWGRSHVNLTDYAAPGDTVQLRFDIGNDGCTGRRRLVSWTTPPSTPACPRTSRPSRSATCRSRRATPGFTAATFKVTLSHASAKPVTVCYLTWSGTALPLLDFVPALNELTIPPLQLQGNITVKVVGEKLNEKDETFFVLLFLPHNGVILDGEGKGTILNDDPKKR